MGLSTYQPRTVDVPIGEKDKVTVHGLSFNDVVFLFDLHQDDINAALGLVQQNVGEAKAKKAAVKLTEDEMLTQLMVKFPALAAAAIAVGCGEPDNIEQARKLPFPVQLEILVTCIELTFVEVGGVKKFVEMIGRVMTLMSKTGKINLQAAKIANTG